MAINIKPLATIVQKYVQRASAAGQAYIDGVNNPKQDWQQATAASALTWAAGVQAAITDGRFTSGVNLAGDAKWSQRSTTVGAQRYPGGITAGQGNYQAKIQPFLQLLSTLNLPARAPKGDPGNLQRVAAVDTALRTLALQLR
jgi:hypothetical protein